MFGIGGGEFIMIILVILMFFGSDKIPEIARTVGKGMAQLKNATNDIKSEIHRNVSDAGIDKNALTGGISEEIEKAKEGFTKMVNDSSLGEVRDHAGDLASGMNDAGSSVKTGIESIAEGPIKRQQ